MKSNIDYSLYLCTDSSLLKSGTLEECVEAAIKGGVSVVQLREKDLSSKDFFNTALKIKKITERYHVPLIINDRLDIALAIKADGVHVGQSDLPCSEVKRIVKNDMIVGVSVATEAEAKQAEADGADYIGVGAMFATGTKTDAKIVSMSELEKIRQVVKVPIVVIGGINKNTLIDFKNRGIDGLAVVSAIVAQDDIKQAAEELLKLWKD